MNMQEAGRIIGEKRRAKNLSRAQLAAQTGMTPQTIAKIEDGTIREIGIRQLSKTCLRLGLQIKVLPEDPPPTFWELLEENEKQKQKDLKITDAIIAGTLAKMSNEKTT
jgi:transcriptional regulator with XRE-family HTH domain